MYMYSTLHIVLHVVRVEHKMLLRARYANPARERVLPPLSHEQQGERATESGFSAIQRTLTLSRQRLQLVCEEHATPDSHATLHLGVEYSHQVQNVDGAGHSLWVGRFRSLDQARRT